MDGKSTGRSATHNHRSDEPDNGYYTLLDTSTLADGPHKLVANLQDKDGSSINSPEVTFEVNSKAGLQEVEPNNSLETANAVAASTAQIAGTVANITEDVGGSKIVRTDSDYYRVKLGAGQTLTVDMLSEGQMGFQVSVLDATGKTLDDGVEHVVASDVERVTYKNGAAAQDVYLWVTSNPFDFEKFNHYRLRLTTQ